MSTESLSLTGPERPRTTIGSFLLHLVDRFLTSPPIDTSIGNTFSLEQRDNLTQAYMEAFRAWGDSSYLLPPEKTLQQKRRYLEKGAFQPGSLITTMGEGPDICAFAITGIQPDDPIRIAENFADSITHVYPELSQISTLLTENYEKILSGSAIPFNDLAVIRKKLSTHIPPYVPRPIEGLLRAHMSMKFLKRHLEELVLLGNDVSTPLVFWTAQVSPLLKIARQRPDSFTQTALFTPKNEKVPKNNPEISIFKTTIGQLQSMLENPFTYRNAISTEGQEPLFSFQY